MKTFQCLTGNFIYCVIFKVFDYFSLTSSINLYSILMMGHSRMHHDTFRVILLLYILVHTMRNHHHRY